jgi:hypothetical protein
VFGVLKENKEEKRQDQNKQGAELKSAHADDFTPGGHQLLLPMFEK